MGTVGYMSPEQVRGKAGRPAIRHLLPRRDPLRNAVGRARLPGRLGRRDDGGDRPEGPARPRRDERPVPAGRRADPAALPREAARRSVRHGARPRLRDRDVDGRFERPRVSAAPESRRRPCWPGLWPPASRRRSVRAFCSACGFTRRRAPAFSPDHLSPRLHRVRPVLSGRPDRGLSARPAATSRCASTRRGSTRSSRGRSTCRPGATVLGISRTGEMALLLELHPPRLLDPLGHARSRGARRRHALARSSSTSPTPTSLPTARSLAVVREIGKLQRLEFPVGKVVLETDGWVSHPRISPDGSACRVPRAPGLRQRRRLRQRRAVGRTAGTGDRGVAGRAGSRLVARREGDLVHGGHRGRGGGGERGPVPACRGAARRQAAPRLRAAGDPPDPRHLRRAGAVLLHARGLSRRDRRTPEGRREGEEPLDVERRIPRPASRRTVRSSPASSRARPGAGLEPFFYFRRASEAAPVRLGNGTALGVSPDGRWVLSTVSSTHGRASDALSDGAGRSAPASARKRSSRVRVIQEFARWSADGTKLLFSGSEPGRRGPGLAARSQRRAARPGRPRRKAAASRCFRPTESPSRRWMPRERC